MNTALHGAGCHTMITIATCLIISTFTKCRVSIIPTFLHVLFSVSGEELTEMSAVINDWKNPVFAVPEKVSVSLQ